MSLSGLEYWSAMWIHNNGYFSYLTYKTIDPEITEIFLEICNGTLYKKYFIS